MSLPPDVNDVNPDDLDTSAPAEAAASATKKHAATAGDSRPPDHEKTRADVENLVTKIAAADYLGRSYDDWFSIGCALSTEFGENGRDYFHKVSCNHPEYTSEETDKKFDDCLKSNGDIKIGTFFQRAKEAGFFTDKTNKESKNTNKESKNTNKESKNTGKYSLSNLLSGFEKVQLVNEQDIEFAQAIIFQGEEPVFWPGTVNLIQGQTGAHKSRVAETIASVIIANGHPQGDGLGFDFRPVSGERYRLLYVDTERNLSDQFPFALQNIRKRAGYKLKERPDNFAYASLLPAPRAERFTLLDEFIKYHRQRFSGHLIIILDVLSDCAADFNDVGGSMELIDMLNVVVNEQNVTFLCVIHENPGAATTNKARGHLGTEASNKASTVLQVGFVKENNKPTDLLQLLYLKRRYGRPGYATFAIYDEKVKWLVKAPDELVGKVTENGPGAREKKEAEIAALLPGLLANGPVASGDLMNLVKRELKISQRTAQDYIGVLSRYGAAYLKNKEGQPCSLEKESKGRQTLYSLKPVPFSKVVNADVGNVGNVGKQSSF